MLQFNNQFRLNLNRIVILYIRCIESSKYYVWKKFDKTCKFKIIYLLLQPLTRKARAFSSVGLEHLPYKQRVGGSNPSTPTLKGSFQSGQNGADCKSAASSFGGSNPSLPTKELYQIDYNSFVFIYACTWHIFCNFVDIR